jgi:hypothetical protein
MGLEQYAIPHDPESAHQLHWEPGMWGKGIYAQDGTLHHWTTGERSDGDPTHRRYMMESPSFGYDPYGPKFRGSDDHHYFWISPEGHLTLLNRENDQASVQAMTQIDPRLARDPDYDQFTGWRFADMQSQDRVLHGGGAPKIVSPHPDASQQQLDADKYYSRRPFVYDQNKNTAYVGAPGQFHSNVYSQYAHHGLRNGYEGYVFKGYIPNEGGEPQPDEAGWFNPPENHREVLDAVAAHHGVPPKHEGETHWNFG